MEDPDLTHAQTLPVDDNVTMRVYTWAAHFDSILMVDFVYADGTRVEGPTDWGFWSIGHHSRDTLLPRFGAVDGTHLYYCPKVGRYEVRRADGTVVRTLSFPVQTVFE